MKKKESVPYEIFEHTLKVSHKLQAKVYKFESFLDYIKENNRELYEKAKSYSNKLEDL
jgi:hypothetical protein